VVVKAEVEVEVEVEVEEGVEEHCIVKIASRPRTRMIMDMEGPST
jgi:hypothetical protein